MEIKKGIGVSPGVVISTAVVLDAEDLLIPKRQVDAAQVPNELARLDRAVADSIVELGKLRDSLTAHAGDDVSGVGGIFDFHMGVLRDRSTLRQITEEVRRNQTTAEYAVSTVMRRYANTFLAMSDRYLSERVKDVHDIERRVLRNLIGQKHEDLLHLTHDVVVIAHDLLPSQTAALDRAHVKGFATDVGGRTSHTAIVARAMGIPAVVGLGNVTSEVSGGDTVIIDGTRGVVIINPDAEQLAEHQEARRKKQEADLRLVDLADLPAQTKDGHEVSVQANIEFPEDVDDALAHGAQGIGLYRTEFLYLASETEPSEDDHYAAYADALRRLGGRPMVIRTLDLCADM